MLKFLGAVLVLFAGTMFGFFQALQYARRPRQIRELITALQRLETEIVYGYTPLPEALLSLGKLSSEPLGSIFRQIREQLLQQKGTPVRDIWRQAALDGWKRSAMKAGELEVFLGLGNTLGLSDRTDQAKHLRLATTQLHAEEETARDEQKRYETMWRSLGVLVGALIVILMY
jgi:stage III sporulation protein AB